VREFAETHKIKYVSGRAPRAIMYFSDIRFPDFIEKQIKNAGFVSPTPIQCAGSIGSSFSEPRFELFGVQGGRFCCRGTL
jgi:hypothetical protein